MDLNAGKSPNSGRDGPCPDTPLYNRSDPRTFTSIDQHRPASTSIDQHRPASTSIDQHRPASLRSENARAAPQPPLASRLAGKQCLRNVA
ncbi:hypothetical protein [Haematobacter sp. UBA3484]|uniref:hypothetical protein n=1 Tax=Haematobacter sp. UBA3484 TaxID=1946582 RepID=UPI0025BE348B|nr:hypothetical protein [Haematobacter sp. UBA3484]